MLSFKVFKRLLIVLTLAATAFAAAESTAQDKPAADSGFRKLRNPANWGVTLMDRSTRDSKDVRAVQFAHWAHRTKYSCKLCHTDLGFPLKANAVDIKHSDLDSGKFCGTCHNGNTSFSTKEKDQCMRCHYYGLEPEAAGNKKMDEYTKGLPKYEFGNFIDWAAALKSAKMVITSTVEGVGTEPKSHTSNVIIPSVKSKPAPPDVKFPHGMHTEMVDCATCHPKPFSDKKAGPAEGVNNVLGGTTPEMNMMKIASGQYCGMCHGKVSFPLEDCFRCHSQPPVPPPVIETPKKDEKAGDKKK